MSPPPPPQKMPVYFLVNKYTTYKNRNKKKKTLFIGASVWKTEPHKILLPHYFCRVIAELQMLQEFIYWHVWRCKLACGADCILEKLEETTRNTYIHTYIHLWSVSACQLSWGLWALSVLCPTSTPETHIHICIHSLVVSVSMPSALVVLVLECAVQQIWQRHGWPDLIEQLDF